MTKVIANISIENDPEPWIVGCEDLILESTKFSKPRNRILKTEMNVRQNLDKEKLANLFVRKLTQYQNTIVSNAINSNIKRRENCKAKYKTYSCGKPKSMDREIKSTPFSLTTKKGVPDSILTSFDKSNEKSKKSNNIIKTTKHISMNCPQLLDFRYKSATPHRNASKDCYIFKKEFNPMGIISIKKKNDYLDKSIIDTNPPLVKTIVIGEKITESKSKYDFK